MQVVSNCPKCACSYGWAMNQVESTPDGGTRPARSPNCPKCGYDVTGSNDRATRNFHYFAKTDDVKGMRNKVQGRERTTQEHKRLQDDFQKNTQEWEQLMKKWEKARKQSPPSFSNLFGLLSPIAPVRPAPPILPRIPPAANVNASDPNNSFNPLVVAAIYGSKNATGFF